MKLNFLGLLQMAPLSLRIWFETDKTWNNAAINVSYDLSKQRLMVKAT